MAATSKRTRVARKPAIRNVVAGTFDGTQEIVEAVVKESTAVPAWRPVRAAAAMALAGANRPEGHDWMTAEEFGRWLIVHFPPRKRHPIRLKDAVGIGWERRRAMLGGARITKVEALAMAHYAMLGEWLPVWPGQVEPFAAWVTARFGAVRAIGKALELSDDYLAARVAGYAITSAGRARRLPDVALIRALDWVWRVGPFSPYGLRLPAQAFPGQTTEDSSCR